MLDMLREMLSLGFMTRALTVGALISLCAALLGVSLVLKNFSMIGDGLSHVGFGALAVATATGAAPLSVAIPVTVGAAFLLLHIGNSKRLKGDAAIALISAGSLAVGIIIAYLSGNSNSELSNYLFGSSALFIKASDLPVTIALAAVVILAFLLLYNRIFALTFDETFAKASGAHTGLLNALLSVLTAITVVLGMRLMGALLISALIIIPALSAMRLFGSFKSVTVTSAILSVACFFIGSVASYAFELPYGASIVVTDLAVFGLFCLVAAMRKLLRRKN